MDSPSSLPSHLATTQSRTLAVDFQWRKFQTLITEFDEAAPDAKGKSLYTVAMGVLAPHLKVKSTQDDQQIGSGTVHAISISPDFELHGSKGTLQAKSRLRTVYEHMSYTFSDTDAPVKMSWSSSSGFKT